MLNEGNDLGFIKPCAASSSIGKKPTGVFTSALLSLSNPLWGSLPRFLLFQQKNTSKEVHFVGASEGNLLACKRALCAC